MYGLWKVRNRQQIGKLMKRLNRIVVKNLLKIPALYLRLCSYVKHKDRYTKEQRYELVNYISRRSMKTGNINLLVTGKENIPDQDGFIFYPNHQRIFDGFAMVEACDRPFSPVIKKELMQVSFVKQIFGCLDAMPMDREYVRQSMEVMIEVMRRVKDKENCLIFSEGTRSREGNKLRDFKGGSFKPAVKTKCPIVPVALIDSYLPFDTETDKPVTVQVHILRPLLYEEYRNMKTVDIAKEVKQRIGNAIESQG